MSFKKDFTSKLKTKEKWPFPQNLDFLIKLEKMAHNSYDKNTTEGLLSALLIFHQLCEEQVRVLIDCKNFFIQCSIYPTELKALKTKKQMFGSLIDELDQIKPFPEIKNFIKHAKKLNDLRIKIVHKIILNRSTSDIRYQAKKSKNIYVRITGLFGYILQDYRSKFNSYKAKYIK